MNICPNCKKETKNPKFCNRSCSVSYNNKIQPKRHKTHNKKCPVCNNIINSSHRKFCSQSCKSIYNDKSYNDEFVNTKLPRKSSSGYICPRRVKKALTQIRGNKCEICSIEKWQDKELIKILDHMDGNSDNWNITNLRLICSNCDSQLPTYKAKNSGNGRYYRRKRYKDNQSY